MKTTLKDSELKAKAAKILYFFSDVDGTLTDGCTYYSARGEEMKKFSHIDGTGFYLLKNSDIVAGIITGENTKIVIRRGEKLDVKFIFIGIEDKLACIKHFADEVNCELYNIAYIGDDINDLELLNNVGLSFAPGNATPKVRTNVDIICKTHGGAGAFREAVECLIKLRS